MELEPGRFARGLLIQHVRVALEHREASVPEELHGDAVGHAGLTQERRVAVPQLVG